MEHIKQKLAFLGNELASQIIEASFVKRIPKGTEILREEQYVKVVPIVLNGLVKIYSRFKERLNRNKVI